MSDYMWGVLAGLALVVVVAAIAKWRRRDKPMSVAEKADYLSNRRARMLPALAVIFLSQQATFFSQMSGQHLSAEKAKISAWLVLSIVMLWACDQGLLARAQGGPRPDRRREYAGQPQRGDALGLPFQHGRGDRRLHPDDVRHGDRARSGAYRDVVRNRGGDIALGSPRTARPPGCLNAWPTSSKSAAASLA